MNKIKQQLKGKMDDLSNYIMLGQIQSEEAAKQGLEILLEVVGAGSKDRQFSQEKTKSFLNMLEKHLKSKQTSPKSKFYSLYMIKLIIERPQSKILSVLASNPLFKYMNEMAKQVDPNKAITEKGKSLFSDKQLGNDYIRLILESLKVLAFRSKSSNQKPTKFKVSYDQLVAMNIVLPKDFKFFTNSTIGSEKAEKRLSSINEVSSTPKSNTSVMNGKETRKDGNKLSEDIERSKKKIETFYDILKDDQQDEQNVRNQCHTFHKSFTKETEKYQTILQSIDYNDQENAINVSLAYVIIDFYTHENELYQRYLADQKDYGSYITEVQIAVEKLFAQLGMNQTQGRKSEKPLKSYDQQPSQTSMRKNNHISDPSQENKQLVSQLMNKLNEKSKSPNVGFKNIKQSLSKQKSLGRGKRSTSGLRRSNATKFGKSMTKSRLSQIFTAPPNPYPRDKRYEGQIVSENSNLSKIMRDITKKQGIRRFITCNFKQKNPLFENSHIQIGVKSQGIYENVNDFKVLIGIELYIGNKTEDLIKNMSINYKGSQDILLYGNPRTIETVLQGGFQQKHELLIVPLKYQFPMIKMYLKYSVNGETVYENITLPNSMLKLASHGNLSKRDFVAQWNASTIYRTPEFKFTRYIAPDALNKYIKPLQELTSYDKFVTKGSQTDYEVGCQVILKQRYEGVLRICIRPNLNAVIQVGVSEETQQAVESFIFYAQTLQMLLTHVDHEQL